MRDSLVVDSASNEAGPQRLVCDALQVALVATRLRVAWHAQAITAERAMQLLDQAFRGTRAREEST